MKKRVIAAMLAGIMVLSVTACGNSSNTPAAAGTETPAAAPTESAEEGGDAEAAEQPAAQPAGPVELTVTTTFAGEDTNA